MLSNKKYYILCFNEIFFRKRYAFIEKFFLNSQRLIIYISNPDILEYFSCIHNDIHLDINKIRDQLFNDEIKYFLLISVILTKYETLISIRINLSAYIIMKHHINFSNLHIILNQKSKTLKLRQMSSFHLDYLEWQTQMPY